MTSRVIASITAAACLLTAAAPATARQKPISGKLTKAGYTVIALGYGGSAVSTTKRAFSITPRSAKVTLQLRDPNGRYAGPVVVGGTKTKVVVGVRAGARLGTIRVLAGYAKAHLAKRFSDPGRTAQARNGVPLGNGKNLGLVRSKKRGATAGGGDRDLDGVPNALDVDVNGNRILNNTDTTGSSRAHAAQDQPGGGQQSFSVFSQIGAPIDISLNANATGVTDEQIDALVQGGTTAPYQPLGTFLVFTNLPQADVELDCGGLTYCLAGGTGLIATPGSNRPDPAEPFPSCCDDDADGWGLMSGRAGPQTPEFDLYPKATSAQIKTGDTMIEHIGDTELPGTLNFVFNTTPALVSWTSTGNDAAQVTYPVRGGTPQAPGDAGTRENPFVVHGGPDGRVAVTVTVWRPQRRAIEGAGEAPGFVDIGHLDWEARLVGNGPDSVVDCQAGVSTTDPSFTQSNNPNLAGLVDSADDAPADAAHTLSYTIDFDACLAGTNNRGGVTFKTGDELQLELVARSPVAGDNSAQQVYFKRG